LADKKVTPYAIYDLKNNESFVNIGTSCDTSDFVCDSIKMWWNTADELLDIRAQIANRDGIVP